MSSLYFRQDVHVVPCNHIRQYAKSTALAEEELLHMEIKQYTPIDNLAPQPGDATIIAAHCAGHPKELYEPLWDELYSLSKRDNPHFRIRSIWIADMATHGASSALNEGKLGNEVSWDDYSLDILHLINHFRDRMPRPIIGFGHSIGGTSIINLALMHPRLFTTIVTVEPILARDPSPKSYALSYAIEQQQDRWPSREAAVTDALKDRIYSSWDHRVFDIWTRVGYRDIIGAEPIDSTRDRTPKPTPVTLSISKHAYLAAFVRSCHPKSTASKLSSFTPNWTEHPELMGFTSFRHPVYRPESLTAFAKLPFLHPTLLLVCGNKSQYRIATEKGRAELLRTAGTGIGGNGGAAEGNVKDAVVPGGHFAPFENPAAVAAAAGQWVTSELSRWQAGELAASRERAVATEQGQIASEVNPETIAWIRKHYGRSREVVKGKQQAPTMRASAKL